MQILEVQACAFADDTVICAEGQKELQEDLDCRLLNCNSGHANILKIVMMTSFTQKVLRLSNSDFHGSNMHRAKAILHSNGYPAHLFNKVLSNLEKQIQRRQ